MAKNLFAARKKILPMLAAGLIANTALIGQIDSSKIETSVFDHLLNGNQNRSLQAQVIDLPLEDGTVHNGSINVVNNQDGGLSYIGSVDDNSSNTFHLEVKDGVLTGQSILTSENKAYEYSTVRGRVYVKEVDINNLICTEFSKARTQIVQTATKSLEANQDAATLESFPGAVGCVLIDFDGHYTEGTLWNSGNPIDAVASNHTDAQKIEVWEIASEDLRPFGVNVTTSEAVYQTYPINRRMRAVVTTTTTAYPGSGGVAYIGSFSWSNEIPCWVFNQSVKACGETVSHEVGHTFSLRHHGQGSTTYYTGQGDWAPIMGASFYRPVSQWSIGDYTGANRVQDDLSLLSSPSHGVGYRTDDHGGNTGSATALVIDAAGNVDGAINSGIIEKTNDLDFFSFTTTGGLVSLDFRTVERHGNLDILAKVYNSNGVEIASVNDLSGLHASYSATLAAGTYYVSIDGTGSGDPLADGYSDYASLGSFFISGNIPNVAGNQAPTVSITAPNDGQTEFAPANLVITADANDADGSVAKVEFYSNGSLLGEDLTAPYTISQNSLPIGVYTLTAVATDNEGATTTSSVVTYNVIQYVNELPNVVITAPTHGTSFIAPAAFDIDVDATDNNGSIVKVEFYSNGTLLGEDLTAPYSIAQSNLPIGTYNLTAVATDNEGGVATSTVVTVNVNPYVNDLPNVVITAPTNGDSYVAPASFDIDVDATDNNGTIVKVEFYSNGVKVGEDLTAPYSIAQTNLAVGSYDLTAVATDNEGGAATSSIVTVNVNPYVNDLPIVVITAPTNNAVFYDPANFDITADASDINGTVVKVEFYSNGTLLGEDLTAPYSLPYSPAIGGYDLTAVATDNEGGVTTSTVVSITVEEPSTCTYPEWDPTLQYHAGALVSYQGFNYAGMYWSQGENPSTSGQWGAWRNDGPCGDVNVAPTCVITNPVGGTVFNAGDNVVIDVVAQDVDGTVTNVEFFLNGISIGSDATSAFQFNWNNVTAGSYDITAVSTDDDGATTTSSVVSVTVNGQSTCNVADWNASTVYHGGMQVAYNGVKYQAKWWTQGDNPSASGPWDVWTNLGACGPVFEVEEGESVNELSEALLAYPNPTTGAFTVELPMEKAADVEITVQTLTGLVVSQVSLANQTSVNQTINLDGVQAGIYFVNVKVNGITATKKVVLR